MFLDRLEITNFRMLRNVDISLENKATVIVGSNNSGKTSLTDIFFKFFADNPRFRLIDFSLSALENFWQSFQSYQTGGKKQALTLLPAIDMKLFFEYPISYQGNFENSENETYNGPNNFELDHAQHPEFEFGPLSEFVIDFDKDCTTAIARIRYQAKESALESLFEKINLDEHHSENKKSAFFREIDKRILASYETILEAIDPTDPQNKRTLELSVIRRLVGINFISAQRGLDDQTIKDKDVLGKVLRRLYDSSGEENAGEEEKKIHEQLESILREVQSKIDKSFSHQLNKLLPTIKQFGYPNLDDPQLATETILEVPKLLRDSTKVRYAGHPDIKLPESYNGLGTRNLIFILFQILEFYKDYLSRGITPGTHLIFIEEPEAHLHPQMQEVFIRQLESLTSELPLTTGSSIPWKVQFIVTTHSSHIANEVEFKAIRYFSNKDITALQLEHLTDPIYAEEDLAAEIRYTCVKDLKKGVLESDWKKHENFLHQYLTLTSCDLFFSKKAILIEGTSERLMIPKMIQKIDDQSDEYPALASQYFTILEVGGNYAQKFFGFLDFLGIQTLIITDMDSGKGTRGEACKVEEGDKTTNSSLKSWFGNDISPDDLIKTPESEKIKKNRRITYQIPESKGQRCGRSFEEAFILANQHLFEIEAGKEYEYSKTLDKTDFALKYAIEDHNWEVPEYIAQGLIWLRAPERTSLFSYEKKTEGITE